MKFKILKSLLSILVVSCTVSIFSCFNSVSAMKSSSNVEEEGDFEQINVHNLGWAENSGYIKNEKDGGRKENISTNAKKLLLNMSGSFIYDHAFKFFPNLEELKIKGKDLNQIDTNAFVLCNNLKCLNLSECGGLKFSLESGLDFGDPKARIANPGFLFGLKDLRRLVISKNQTQLKEAIRNDLIYIPNMCEVGELVEKDGKSEFSEITDLNLKSSKFFVLHDSRQKIDILLSLEESLEESLKKTFRVPVKGQSEDKMIDSHVFLMHAVTPVDDDESFYTSSESELDLRKSFVKFGKSAFGKGDGENTVYIKGLRLKNIFEESASVNWKNCFFILMPTSFRNYEKTRYINGDGILKLGFASLQNKFEIERLKLRNIESMDTICCENFDKLKLLVLGNGTAKNVCLNKDCLKGCHNLRYIVYDNSGKIAIVNGVDSNSDDIKNKAINIYLRQKGSELELKGEGSSNCLERVYSKNNSTDTSTYKYREGDPTIKLDKSFENKTIENSKETGELKIKNEDESDEDSFSKNQTDE